MKNWPLVLTLALGLSLGACTEDTETDGGGTGGDDTISTSDASGDVTGSGDIGEDSGEPDTMLPDTQMPDTQVPDTQMPDTQMPDAGPDSDEPDGDAPDTGEPDTDDPDTGDTTQPVLVDWCRLQAPLDPAIEPEATLEVFGRVRVVGLTDLTSGNDTDADLLGRVGRGATGTLPETWTEWVEASPNTAWDGDAASEPANDEYVATLPAIAVGDYDFAFQFSLDGGTTWTSCDRNDGVGSDGSEDGYQPSKAGHLTVADDPCSPNPCTVGQPGTCDANIATGYATDGTCAVVDGEAECTYAALDPVDCGENFCTDGACNEWRLAVAGDLRITEIMPNPSKVFDSLGEWFELQNVSEDPVNLIGLTFIDNGSKPLEFTEGWVMQPGDLLVFGINGDMSINGGLPVDFVFPFDGLSNNNDYLSITRNGETVEAVDYSDDGLDLSIPNGRSVQAGPGTDNQVAANWCPSYTTYGDGDFGTPGAPNQPCSVTVDFCRLHAPATVSTAVGGTFTATGRWQSAGLTDVNMAGNDLSGLVSAGFALVADADLANDPADWTWTAALPNSAYNDTVDDFEPALDEWSLELTAPDATGTWALAFRVSGDGGSTWTYCDLDAGPGADGSEDGFSTDNLGVVMVTSPCEPNPCEDVLDQCSGDILQTWTVPGSCTVVDGSPSCDYGDPAETNCAATEKRCDDASLSCVDCLVDADCPGPFSVCDTDTHTCVAGCIDDGLEPNPGSDPTMLTSDYSVTDLVLCAGDSDWFQVELGELDTITINLDFVHADGDLEVALGWREQEETVATANTDTDGETITYTVPDGQAGHYDITIRGVAGAQNVYGLSVTFDNDPCTPNPCTDAPVAACDNGSLIQPPTEGICAPDGDGVSCDYDTNTTTTTCDNFCIDGACTDWRYPEAAGELVITELMVEPLNGTPYIEVFNTTDDMLNLEGLSVDDGTNIDVIDAETLLPAGEWMVLGLGSGGDVVLPQVTLGPATTLTLTHGVELDVVSYDKNWPLTEGAAMSLSGIVATGETPATDNDLAENWCSATSAMDNGDFGTPGSVNPTCPENWTIGYCQLRFPESATLLSGGEAVFYGRVYVDGLTTENQTGNDANDSLVAAVGYGPVGSDPNTDESWRWFAGTTNPTYGPSSPGFSGNDDEYVATLMAGGAPGTFDVAFRFSGDAGSTWTVCDLSGVGPDDAYTSAEAGAVSITNPMFLSEYVEGSSNNKGVEIFNPGASAMDLAALECGIRRYFNGADFAASDVVPLTGTVPAGGTWTFCDDGYALGACGEVSSSGFWNGNDVVELTCAGTALDIIGQIGVTDAFAQNLTLQRQCDVSVGDTDGSDVWNADDSWLTLDNNDVSGFGAHAPRIFPTWLDSQRTVAIVGLDLTTTPAQIVLLNTGSDPYGINENWRLCSAAGCGALVSAEQFLVSGAPEAFEVPAALTDVVAGGIFELRLFWDGTETEASLQAYLAVNGIGQNQSLAVSAGLWVTDESITLSSETDGGLVALEHAGVRSASDYRPYALACGPLPTQSE